jgi:hypothetical protein
MILSVDFIHLPNSSSAGKTTSAQWRPEKRKPGDATGQPDSRSSFLRVPSAKFFSENSDRLEKSENDQNEKHLQLPSGVRV